MGQSSKAYHQAYNFAHKERIAARKKAHRATHMDECRARAKAWRDSHKKEHVASVMRWQKKNPERVKETHRASMLKHKEERARYGRERQREKRLVVNSFKKQCLICGESDIRCLDFHHRNPSEKSFVIARNNMSLDKLLGEIEKCDVLCANCHRKLQPRPYLELRA